MAKMKLLNVLRESNNPWFPYDSEEQYNMKKREEAEIGNINNTVHQMNDFIKQYDNEFEDGFGNKFKFDEIKFEYDGMDLWYKHNRIQRDEPFSVPNVIDITITFVYDLYSEKLPNTLYSAPVAKIFDLLESSNKFNLNRFNFRLSFQFADKIKLKGHNIYPDKLGRDSILQPFYKFSHYKIHITRKNNNFSVLQLDEEECFKIEYGGVENIERKKINDNKIIETLLRGTAPVIHNGVSYGISEYKLGVSDIDYNIEMYQKGVGVDKSLTADLIAVVYAEVFLPEDLDTAYDSGNAFDSPYDDVLQFLVQRFRKFKLHLRQIKITSTKELKYKRQ